MKMTLFIPVNASITKTANATLIGNNTLVKFTISVNYTGSINATNVTVKDALPDGFTFVSATGDYTINGQEIVWHFDQLSKGYFEFEIVAISNAVGVWNNTVTASCNENSTVIVDNATVEVAPVNITVIKDVDVKTVDVLGLVNFTITVTNNGKITANNVTITDIMDLSVFEIKNHNGTYVQDGNNLVWNIGSLNAGDSYTIWIQVKALTHGTYTNVVNVTSFENKTVSSDKVSVDVIPVVNLTVVKTVDVDVIGLYDHVVFTINVTNNGPSNATNVVIKDVLPLGLKYVDSDIDNYDYYQPFIIPLIKQGESFVFSITAYGSQDGNWTNKVNVSCDENATVKSDNASVEVVKIDLIINKTSNITVAGVNSLINFTISVTNPSEVNATNVVVLDNLPDGLEFVNATEGYTIDNDVVNWHLGTLAKGETVYLWILAKSTMIGNLTNHVEVSCFESNLIPNANCTVQVAPVILTVEKTADSEDYAIGDIITYTIVVTNDSPCGAYNVVVKDILDPNLTYLSGDLEQVIPYLAGGKSTMISIKALAKASGTYLNRVNVYCQENDTVKSANVTVQVLNSDLRINKTTADTKVYVGNNVNFTIEINNHGRSNATNIQIVDILDSAFEFVDANGNYSRDGQRIVWTIDNLAKESCTVWVVVKALSNGTFTNIAHANCTEEGTLKNSSATVEVIKPRLSATQTANDDFVYKGNQTSFTIKITNNENIVINGIHVEDTIPNGLIYDSFIGPNWTYNGTSFLYNGSLGVGESIELTIVVNTTKSGNFTNLATVGSDETDAVDTDASVLVFTPALTVREIANNPTAIVGQAISFDVVVTNIGDCELTGIYTLNNFPDGLIYTGYDGGSWTKLTSGLLGAYNSGWTQDGNKFVYSGSLKPGESAKYTLFFDTTVSGVFTPEVLANSDLTQGAYSNNTTVVLAPSIKVVKTADKDSVKVGELITFTITVINNGNCDVGGIFVIEKTPGSLEYISFSGNGWTKVGNKFTYSGVLAPNEQASFKIVFKAIKAGNITNVVIAGANMTGNVTDSADVEIIAKNGTKHDDKNNSKTHPAPKKVSHATKMHETGNPLVLLLLAIIAIIPIKRRKQ